MVSPPAAEVSRNAVLSYGQSPTLPISQVLFEQANRRFGSLAAVPSNVHAIEAALLFSTGLHTFVTIFGPSGWGKSHLLESTATNLSRGLRNRLPILSATDWLMYPHLVDPAQPLLLDDVQDALLKTRTKVQLRLALERRVRAGRPTILSFTAAKSTRQLRNHLPSLHLWTVAAMSEPAVTERILIVNQMATAEGLTISPALAKLLALRMKGNGRTLIGAMKRLKIHGSQWLDTTAILRACGVLDPFFADNSAWDLKGRMAEAAELTQTSLPNLPWRDLMAYAMLREADLPEAMSAHFLKLTPAKAYQRAAAFAVRMEQDEAANVGLRQYIDQVVELLVRE